MYQACTSLSYMQEDHQDLDDYMQLNACVTLAILIMWAEEDMLLES